MQHIEKLPLELCCQPEPVVVLSGLDVDKNQIHRSIWRTFNAFRPRERGCFKFQCKPVGYKFLVPKPKVSYFKKTINLLLFGLFYKVLKFIFLAYWFCYFMSSTRYFENWMDA